jgi:hypothetical protein
MRDRPALPTAAPGDAFQGRRRAGDVDHERHLGHRLDHAGEPRWQQLAPQHWVKPRRRFMRSPLRESALWMQWNPLRIPIARRH